jgi:uncharacterized protein with FMN-binding domain
VCASSRVYFGVSAEIPPAPSGASSSWFKSNLAAIGSAAVLAVYAVGYARTEAAAARFADEPLVRRSGSPKALASGAVNGAIVSRGGAAAAAAPDTSTPAASPAAPPSAAKPQAKSEAKAPAKSEPTATAPVKAAPPTVAATVAAAAPPTVAPKMAPPIATVPAPSVTAAVPQPAPTVAPTPAPATPPASPPQVAATTAAPAPAPAAEPADPAERLKPPFKNGTFSGWGTSRHGDIQATVEIQDGWIVSAKISQCLTQYSCSWIEALPPQVTVRQSPGVDYVTGATQSSNAFYGALVQALSKAK